MIILLDDNSSLEIEEGATAKDLALKLKLTAPDQALAVQINGKTVDLSHSLTDGDQIKFLNFDSEEGKEVFWHTSAHVLAQAILRLFPEAKPTIGPPIENGFYYDFANLHITEEDLSKIEKEMKVIVKENYLSEREKFQSKEEAKSHFSDNKYKIDLIESFENDAELSAYRQGEFFDLCRGPHLPNLGKIKALKVMKTSGAYWRGDSKQEMLTRIYGTSFPNKDLLKKHLHLLEESKKRDHKVLGPKLDLFSLHEEAPGMPFIHPKGLIIWNTLLEFYREKLKKYRYTEIKTPPMMIKELWEKSGHWENYREHMFIAEIEDREFAIKPMNCPGCMIYYKHQVHSYRELPLRVAEFGCVQRYEPSGSLSGLFRVRSFHQDDAHIFMEPNQIETEVQKAIQFADEIYSQFNLDYHIELSTRPEENTVGSDEDWEIATNGLKTALESSGKPYQINEGDGAFYGPKIDLHVNDALGRSWQCCTIQLDMSLPRRFDLEYTAADGTRKRPVMIHRAIFGSIERFFGILIEHFAGKFPLWISPLQIRLITVADRHVPYAEKVLEQLQISNFHSDLDDSNESVSKKIRNAQLSQINYIMTIGDKEVENQTLSLRTRDNVVHGEVSLDSFIDTITVERNEQRLVSSYSSQ